MEEFIAEGALFSTLFTGENNRAAQSVYRRLGYAQDREMHFTKRLRG